MDRPCPWKCHLMVVTGILGRGSIPRYSFLKDNFFTPNSWKKLQKLPIWNYDSFPKFGSTPLFKKSNFGINIVLPNFRKALTCFKLKPFSDHPWMVHFQQKKVIQNVLFQHFWTCFLMFRKNMYNNLRVISNVFFLKHLGNARTNQPKAQWRLHHRRSSSMDPGNICWPSCDVVGWRETSRHRLTVGNRHVFKRLRKMSDLRVQLEWCANMFFVGKLKKCSPIEPPPYHKNLYLKPPQYIHTHPRHTVGSRNPVPKPIEG